MTVQQLETRRKLDEQLEAWGIDKSRRERAIQKMYDLRKHKVKIVLSVESDNHYLWIDDKHKIAI